MNPTFNSKDEQSWLIENHTDTIAGIVTKRNNIIHHNDDASDITFDDILSYIDSLIEYMGCIDNQVCTFLNYEM